ncbi:PREDICTED: speedy protein C [Elephantulus edwardii]|uniref:speedy protein C n=1 Tax=Elephantulus edwardii TaxID=28737 RepID=UPI0003F09A8A|nr:PREDICTED: speedy protein C [Elephantulus edwardii]
MFGDTADIATADVRSWGLELQNMMQAGTEEVVHMRPLRLELLDFQHEGLTSPSTSIFKEHTRCLPDVESNAGHPALPHSHSYKMSAKSQDPATGATQMRDLGESWPGRESLVVLRQHQELRTFLNLLENSYLQEFFSQDPCFMISDKYLLAMVLVYFRRARLPLCDYTPRSFFLALYLANDMEEDLENPKCEIFPWALGKDWRYWVVDFLHQRERLWARMGFRAAVSRECCEEVMAKEPTHWAWTRARHPHHGAAQRRCPEAPVPLPRGPGLSPPYCSLCSVRRESSAKPGITLTLTTALCASRL